MKLFQDNAERRERELRSRLAILEKRAEKKKQKSMSDVYEDMKKSSDDEQPSSSMSGGVCLIAKYSSSETNACFCCR